MANQVIMPDSKYYPDPNKSQAKNVGDVESARAHFLANRPTNLEFMLQNRYKWMNKYLDGLDYIFELGSGSGLSKEWIDSQNIELFYGLLHKYHNEDCLMNGKIK